MQKLVIFCKVKPPARRAYAPEGKSRDYAYAKNIIMLHCPDSLGDHILFSPASGIMSPADLAGWILGDNLNVRLHVQLHKLIWPDKNKGV
ncbi:MAG: hypothetical protein JRE28_08470 [Deltaproteobacteria bacterium]|nr:hypothetical protein [Deltaproteobacteria bacterium]